MKTTGFFTFGPRRTALSSTIAPRSSKPGRKVQSPFLQNAMPMSRTQVNEVLWFLSWVLAPFAKKSSSDRVAFTKHLNADWRFWLHCDALPWGTPFDFQDSTSTKLLIELSWTYCPFFNSDLEPIAACLEFLSRGSWEGQDQAIHSSFCTVPSLVHMVSESQHSDTSDTSIYLSSLLLSLDCWKAWISDDFGWSVVRTVCTMDFVSPMTWTDSWSAYSLPPSRTTIRRGAIPKSTAGAALREGNNTIWSKTSKRDGKFKLHQVWQRIHLSVEQK